MPLADLLRPQILDELVGQEHLLQEGGWIYHTIKQKVPLSVLLWGPPGSGKTTLAKLYAKEFSARFITLSATFSGIADIRRVVQEVENSPLFHKFTILFVDEIHRFNKAQQDAFLPYIENGTFILVGATTENPSFTLNNALLSRMRVLTLNSLNLTSLEKILSRYEATYKQLNLEVDARKMLLELAKGDGRYLLNMVESLHNISFDKPISIDLLKNLLQKRAPLYDRGGEGHYNLISALHKAVRGSDPNASLYWFARMVEGGEDLLFLARRIIRMATEDIGLADPEALKLAVSAFHAYQMLGSPEGDLALSEAIVYLALAPKSNSLYKAHKLAYAVAKETSELAPPLHICNAPTKLMKDMGYGKNYIYDHDLPSGFSGSNYFPDSFEPVIFYEPVERGFEREMKKRIDYFTNLCYAKTLK
ncbi:MAG: replication-associated recombination protein A [Chlamydiales bacterium]|nr:replication-associated recombination protein A [Chlamydiales bacterium]